MFLINIFIMFLFISALNWYLWIFYICYFLIFILILLILVLVERKFFAIAQRRVGPSLLGRNGIYQIFADLFKTLNKFHIASTQYKNYGYWIIGFYFVWHLCSLQFLCISWFYFIHIDCLYLILFQLLFSTISNCLFIYIGIYLNSRYNFIAMTRAILNNFIVDLFFVSTYLLIFLLTRSTLISDIIDYQQYYFLFFLPFPCSICCIFQLIYESKRTPFDNLEAESELVSGYTTDIGGFNLMILLLVEYIHIVLGVCLSIFFFFGASQYGLFEILYIFLLFI